MRMAMAARQVLDDLLKVVPSNSQVLLFDNGKDVRSVIENTMKVHRQVFLSNLLEKPPSFFQRRRLGEFIATITTEPGTFKTGLPPLQDQFITKIVEYFIKQPENLVKVAYFCFKKMRSAKYQRFSYSCIPAIFGFYTSAEHLQLARPFLSEVAKQSDVLFVKSVLEPLFCSLTTFRYVKSLADFLFQGFCKDLLLVNPENRKAIFADVVVKLRNELIARIDMLPCEHLTVLKDLVNNGMDKTRVFTFFIDNFIHPHLSMFFSGSAYLQLLPELGELMKLLKASTQEEFAGIFEAESRLIVPSMFHDFDTPFVMFIMTPKDAQTLYKASVKVISFPNVLTMTLKESFIHKQPLIPGFYRIYPRTNRKSKTSINVVFTEKCGLAEVYDIPRFQKLFLSLRKVGIDSGKQPLEVLESRFAHAGNDAGVDLKDLCEVCKFKIITEGEDVDVCENCTKRKVTFHEYVVQQSLFEVEQLSRVFETFTAHLTGLHELEDQYKTVVHMWELCLSSLCEVVMPTRSITKVTLETSFKVLNTSLTKKIAYIAYLYKPLMEVWNSEWKRAVSVLEDRWINVIALEEDDIPMKENESESKHEKMMTHLNGISDVFGAITKVPESRKYLLLAQCLEALDIVIKSFGLGQEAVKYVLKKSNQIGLVSVFLISSALLMKKNDFQVLCSPSELNRWCEFEEVIMNIVDMNDDLSNVYYRLEEEILMKFSDL